MIFKNSLLISHEIISKVIKEGDVAIDATAGNGNDTLFLAQLVGTSGKVYAFDIQETAINNTKQRLSTAGVLDRTILILDGHNNLDRYVSDKVKCVMFNLGYLPKGDHSKGTKADTTIMAIDKSLKLLELGGIISIVVYYGGDSGFEEKEAVMEYIKTIDNKKYTVITHTFVNQINCPPIAICIERFI